MMIADAAAAWRAQLCWSGEQNGKWRAQVSAWKAELCTQLNTGTSGGCRGAGGGAGGRGLHRVHLPGLLVPRTLLRVSRAP